MLLIYFFFLTNPESEESEAAVIRYQRLLSAVDLYCVPNYIDDCAKMSTDYLYN